jgi:hypothetical protein
MRRNDHGVDFDHAEHAPPTHTKENVEGVFFSNFRSPFKFETFCDHAANGRLVHVQQALESGELLVGGNGKVYRALVEAAENG